MSSNGQAEVGRALELLREGLGPFVEQAVRNKPLKRHIEDFLSSNSRKKLKGKRVTEWDVAALMNFMQHMWHEVFRHVLGRSERAFVSELQDCRNKWAHQERLAPEDVLRHLDSAARLLRAINAESQADKVAELRGRFIQAGRTPSPRHDPLPSSPQPQRPSPRPSGCDSRIRAGRLCGAVAQVRCGRAHHPRWRRRAQDGVAQRNAQRVQRVGGPQVPRPRQLGTHEPRRAAAQYHHHVPLPQNELTALEIQCRLRLLWLWERSLGGGRGSVCSNTVIGRSNETLRLQDGTESASGARFSG